MARKLLDKILVLDLEATCSDIDRNFKNEIIEIGVCLLDIKTGAITDNRGLIVKNEYSPVTPFCTQLTTLTQAFIDREGMFFKEACDILVKNYKSDQRIMASYGFYDVTQMDKDCRAKNVQNPLSTSHINVKTLFAVKNKLDREVGMDKALEIKKFSLEGVHHCGKDDSYNIAKLLKTLI